MKFLKWNVEIDILLLDDILKTSNHAKIKC